MLDAALSAILQLALLGGLPFLCYLAFQTLLRKRSFQEIRKRAGLQLCGILLTLPGLP
jgi:hypothetical protein